jgi:hypothetical protein
LTDYTAQITALEAALASGELTVEYNGRRVTYRSPQDILVAIAYLRRLSEAPAPGQPAPATASRTTLATFGSD